MMCAKSITTGRWLLDLKLSVGVGDGEVGVRDNGETGKHPRMDIALDAQELDGFVEGELRRRTVGDLCPHLRPGASSGFFRHVD